MFRSIFTTLYVLISLVGLVVMTIHFGGDNGSVGRFAGLVSYAIACIWWIYLFTVRLRNASFAALIVTVTTATSLLIAIGSHYVSGDGSEFSIQASLLAFFMWLVYHLVVSKYKKLPKSLEVGQSFPDHSLEAPDGTIVRLSEIPGKKLLIFNRGKWCPFCVDQAREFAELSDRFQDNNVKVFIVSTERFSNMAAASFGTLRDSNGALGKQLGISAPNSLPIGLGLFGFQRDHNEPMGVLLDEGGKILAAHKAIDNRKRSSPQWFLRYL